MSKLKSLSRGERVVARISNEDKRIITQAASLTGQSLSTFVVVQARKAALETIETYKRVDLNAKESLAFVQALLAPPAPPSEHLKRALKHYSKEFPDSN